MTTIVSSKGGKVYFVSIKELNIMINMLLSDDNPTYYPCEHTRIVANIEDKRDVEILKVLLRNSSITFEGLYKKEYGNPFYEAFQTWKDMWRSQCIKTTLSWRNGVESYIDICNSVGIGELDIYMEKLKNTPCLVYDDSMIDEETAVNMLNKHNEAIIASAYINSIGRSELQTKVEGTNVVLK
jgi:hypothetical protein